MSLITERLNRLRANPGVADDFPGNLTARERQVLDAMAEFGSRKIAADRLGITVTTLGDHLKSCSAKASASCAVLLVARYLKATLGSNSSAGGAAA